ncbi:glycosyltransferase family 4 protein [Thalassotalea psychrophila]|uniref:Glycosyltransferase family 4 protein n=1 Tax=Thalassotalea psychrophila TaxID=3065647 RepID=A0ABY9TRB6_9GAMM|nr:glycosyltransferase family 4 protein [Colwelliaceae bacterium SQ149]
MKKSHYKGYIDWVSSGFVRGWVFNPENNNEECSFSLKLNDEIIVESKANLFRADVKKAGFGNGKYGYCIKHGLTKEHVEDKELTLLDKNGNQIGKSHIIKSAIGVEPEISRVSIENEVLSFYVNVNDNIGLTFQVFHENSLFAQENKQLVKGKNELKFKCPISCFKDEFSHFTIGAKEIIDALWSNRIKTRNVDSSSNTALKGYIDMISSGFIRGWVFNKNEPDVSVNYKLEINGEVFFEGTASQYRADLEKIGFGNGKHGFCVEHKLPGNALQGNVIRLLDTNNIELIKPQVIYSKFITNAKSNAQVIDVNLALNELCIEIESSSANEIILQIFDDGFRICQKKISLRNGNNIETVLLPKELLNNKKHEITIGRGDCIEYLWSDQILLEESLLEHQPNALNSSLKGYIDCVSSGFIRGWVYNKNKPKEHIDYSIELDGKIISFSTAYDYRKDLIDAGIGNGEHGFCFKHDKQSEELSGKILRLLDSEGALVGKSFQIGKNNKPQFKIVNLSIYQHLLIIDVDVEIAAKLTFQCFFDTDRFFQRELSLGIGLNVLEVPLPEQTDTHHDKVLTIGVLEFIEPIWQQVVHLPQSSLDLFSSGPLSIEYFCATDQQSVIKRARLEAYQLRLSTNNNSDDIDYGSYYQWLNNPVSCPPKLMLQDHEKPQISIVLLANQSFDYYVKVISSLILSVSKVKFEVITSVQSNSQTYLHLREHAPNLILITDETDVISPLKVCVNKASTEKLLFINYANEICSGFLDELYKRSEYNFSLVTASLINEELEVVEQSYLDFETIGTQLSINHPENSYFRKIDAITISPFIIDKAIVEQYLLGYEGEEEQWQFGLALSEFLIQKNIDLFFTPFAQSFKVLNVNQNSESLNINEPAQSFSEKFEQYKIEQDKRGCDLRPTILLIDRSIPRPDRDAGSFAAVNDIKLLQSLGFHVVFIPNDFLYSIRYTEQLQYIGVEVVYAPYFASPFEALEYYLPKVSCIYITRYQNVEKYLPTIKAFSENVPVLFNNADLHFLREMRQAHLHNDKFLLENAEKTREREVEVMKSVDAILSYNEIEHVVIASHTFKTENIFKGPWVLSEKTSGKPFIEREGVSFLGGYDHLANVQAFEYFIKDILPVIVERTPDIKFYFYGSNMPEHMKNFQHDNVIMVGYVESLGEVYANHRVFIAPLLFGAGVKGKVLESAAYGLPSVLSPIAVEATGLIHNVSTLVATTTEEWVTYIEKLYLDNYLWDEIAKNQKQLVNSQYSFENAQEQFKMAIDYVGIKLPYGN